MFDLFKSRQKTHCFHNCSEKVENNSRDYQIIIGENLANTSTSQNNLCQSQNSFCHNSHNSSFENSTNEYNRIFRDYTSSPHLFLLVLFLVIYILLILLGASVFSLFEQKAEFQIRDHLLRTQQNFLAKHPSIDAESLDAFVEAVIKGLDNGVNLHELNQLIKKNKQFKQNKPTTHSLSPTPTPVNIDNKNDGKRNNKVNKHNNHDTFIKQTPKTFKSKELIEERDEDSGIFAFSIPNEYSNWEFTSSLLFVTSVVTTIGYGHVTPITVEGKIFCLVFSCVAIPFTLVFLSIIVSLLKNGPVKKFEKWLIRTISTHFQNTPEFFIRILHVLIVTLILLLLILIFPALIFSNVENEWSFLDSIYYCYISLTTVGLGDFVPATTQFTEYQSLQLYRICIIVYLYGGLALIMLWIAVILRIPQLNLKPLLLTEKEEIDEHSNIIDYNKDNKQNSYGTNTQLFAQK